MNEVAVFLYNQATNALVAILDSLSQTKDLVAGISVYAKALENGKWISSRWPHFTGISVPALVPNVDPGVTHVMLDTVYRIDGVEKKGTMRCISPPDPIAPLGDCAGNFIRTWASPWMHGETAVFWELSGSMKDASPYWYRLEWAYSSNGPWTDIPASLVADTFFTYDPEQRLWGKDMQLYYRVKLVTAKPATYYSVPINATGGLPKHEWLLAREVIRGVYMRLIKTPAGVRGCLFKRKNWGPTCTVCTDFDTGEPAKSDCLICFGTGITGGYYAPVEYWISQAVQQQRYTRGENRGQEANITLQDCDCVPYPWLMTGDIWVSSDTDRRWVVQTVGVKNWMRDTPLVLGVELRLAPVTDIIYSLALGDCAARSSGRWPLDPCD